MHSVAILAGGQATRFGGRDKSALVIGGRTILDRQIAELSALSTDLLIVGDMRPGARAFPASAWPQEDQATARLADAPEARRRQGREVRAIADLVPGCGPLGGVHAALTEARGDAVFVVACDMPYVTAPLGAFLLDLARDADLVVPRTERGYHPLCAVYTRACLAAVARRVAERRLALRDLVADVRARVVTVEELDRFGACDRLLANVNTPAEYAGLESTDALQGHQLS
ncbi:MAG: molybdenum cofactor guanylyltransferase [Acidobacteria bacterium]|nr:molybdenum cofactor guanylyltransferase [Acidobacteriota bacterium]